MAMPLRRALTAALVMLALGTTVPAAQTQTQTQGIAGPYLAASQADLRNDYLAAAEYYDAALAKVPDNPALLNNALVVNIAAGRIDRALFLAERLQTLGSQGQIVALTRLADALHRDDFDAALVILRDEEDRMNSLFTRAVAGWALVGKGDFAGGQAVFDEMAADPALEGYGLMNKALALAFAGDFGSAAEILDGTPEEGPLHLNRLALLTHVVSLAQADRRDAALDIVEREIAAGRIDAVLETLRDKLVSGEELVFDLIPSAADGAVGVYSFMAGAFLNEQAERLSLVHARLALHIRPGHHDLTTLVGDILAVQGLHELAIAAYRQVPPSSIWHVGAEAGRAEALHGAGRVGEAVEVLSSLSRARPESVAVHTALGDMLREDEQFARAAEAYSAAIELIDTEVPGHWRLYYARGITLERTDRWDEAEADFRHALELNPDQPNVLNYLGYSLVEMRRNLAEAEQMIRTAVEQRPQDGYITDSLGWVLYRLGRFEEAVAPMERAVELMPVDPIVNDHLGDVLWMVGREMEAQFQWRRAMSFGPEEEDAERIRRKLEVGLDKVLAEEAAGADGGDAKTADGR